MVLKGLLLSSLLGACAGGARNDTPPLPRPTPALTHLQMPAPRASSPPSEPPPPAPAEASQLPRAVVVTPPEPSVPSESPPRALLPPEATPPPPCALETTVKVTRRRGLYLVSAMLRNLTNERLEFDLPGVCPHCSVNFSGLPSGYAYYPACAASGCSSPPVTIHYSLPPGEPVVIDAIEIDPVQTNCKPSVRAGRYEVSFSLPTAPTSLRACGRRPGKVVLDPPKTVKCPPRYECARTTPCY